MIIAISLVCALIGLFMFLACSQGNLKEVGRIMLFCGLLTFLLHIPVTAIHIP